MTPDVAEIAAILTVIDEHPELWDQQHYGLNTDAGMTCCVAGHALLRKGYTPVIHPEQIEVQFVAPDGHTLDLDGFDTERWDAAQKILGLSKEQAWDLFYAGNTREHLTLVLREIAATVPVAAS